jgi:hypothetical protein
MKKILSIFAAVVIMTGVSQAQMTKADKKATIDSIIVALKKLYVFPDVALRIETHLRQQQSTKKYDTVSNAVSFAEMLTADIRHINQDRHLRVGYSEKELSTESQELLEIPAAEKEAYAQWLLSQNYGIRKLEILPGNIGYIDFTFFCGPEYAGDTYAAAMNYVNHTDALIIDLRDNGGAMSTEVIPFLCSYFFERSTHLNDIYWRKDDITIQSWTHAVVPGKKYLNKPIFILTSNRTFSGAEELAYDLKNLKRATLVGEKTGGGANPGGTVNVTKHFSVFIPNGRAINPITKTNWEGTGVQPDTLVKSVMALQKAKEMALRHLISGTKNPNWKEELKNILATTEKARPVYKNTLFKLEGYENAKEVFVTGSFNRWSPTADKMQRIGKAWQLTVETEPGKHMYKFIVDGKWILDPANKDTAMDNGYTNSLLEVK